MPVRSVPPLSRSDYALATKVQRHLDTNDIDAEELFQPVLDFAPVVGAQYASLSILNPGAPGKRQIAVRTLHVEPATLGSIISATERGNPIVGAISQGEPEALSVASLPRCGA
jgi:hypothetical protein